MVKISLKASTREVPISVITAAGQSSFLTDIATNSDEFKGTDADRLRLIYNGRIQDDELLKKLTDEDAIRVICLPESKIKKPISEEARQKSDEAMAMWSKLWRNPDDRRLPGFAHEFANPNHVRSLLKKYPGLIWNSRFLAVLSDWYTFYYYCVANEYADDAERNEFKYTVPEFPEVLKTLLTTMGQKYGFRFDGTQSSNTRARQPQQPGVITQDFLQNALQFALAAVNAPRTDQQPGPAPPVVAPPPEPAQDDPMIGNLEQSLATIRSFGFENDELIMLALEQSNGDIQGAMEFLIELNQ
uniref:UBA domain-containing protein n=1 Tax=Caenorhabditis japonica TaxID=281687 RepID=A0A8R1DR62_CAEJA